MRLTARIAQAAGRLGRARHIGAVDRMGSIIFITATDTGVGKTLLTALLLTHLRCEGVHALAMKPFCSGGLSDVHILRRAQHHELSIHQINPYYFDQPLAPLAARSKHAATVALTQVARAVRSLARRCEVLLVEGAGGVLVPLGGRDTIADLIACLGCPAIVAARNKLGTINHTLLSLEALRQRGVVDCRVVLMAPARADASFTSNARLIQRFDPAPIVSIPFLGANPCSSRALAANAKKIQKTLARILREDMVSSAFGADAAKPGNPE